MKFSALLLFFIFCCIQLFAQNKPVQGFVIDKDNKLRLAKVYIYNPATDEGLYNNTKGEFTIKAKVGDTLFAALSSYGMDTVVYKGQSAILFQLKSLAINLKEVKIFGKQPTAAEQYAKKLQDYKYAIDKGSSKDLLNIGPRGVGLGIDAIYNLLSKSGKNARHLQAILEKDYHEAIIDYRFRPDYVRAIVAANDTELKDFMLQYRPTYQFVLTASDYAFVQFVKNSYASYKRNPSAFRLPSLPRVTLPNFSYQNQ
ncbi:carboxypeptidase-like regulatory domain-containing protein [Pedobacter polaris]|uniref:Carboxypeptidase-like regulatory domain-containing protein n=1 Tax=Pedobacter polaris TaxID=2571273 RepID=A0A4U1CWN7_9SPHI|nr:carboxypeptidase-like regulatory domain-containing protein [Pedobacter polaris]TKC12725.1 carboxypeptidase-like regulatory domain-containing protein [Pedobacter polaris]